MAKYIKHEKIWEMLHAIGGCGAKPDTWADGWDKAINAAISKLDELPADDVRPERHGEWYNWGRDWKCCQHFQCSECKKEVVRCIDSKAQFQYCPYCGAKMDGKEGE